MGRNVAEGSEKKCERAVAFMRGWPGRPNDWVCAEHGEDTAKVAQALGFPDGIHLSRIDFSLSREVGAPVPDCACTEGRLQEIFIQTSEESDDGEV